ncbi:MAG: fibronectin type III domain-containing protein [Prevotella sp.]|nr:fibronectin type III domain-containing protein [Prevotella sp.]
MGRAWGDIDYNGDPWVSNASRPHRITEGLNNRHIAVWASHGRYFDQKKNSWKWQRPNLFATTEDLFTQTIVVPYLIPMLENAGANVFSPRERDWQSHEVIVDNDDAEVSPYYAEHQTGKKWKDAKANGFAIHRGTPYQDRENPFDAGRARRAKATSKSKSISTISYRPEIPEAGRYAVYVSYPTMRKSVSDALYTVYHKGQKTLFKVNQKMGSGTWVYLGTFDFDKGCDERNQVVVSNLSSHKGYVGSDAVRFGGGMGNIERGGTTSGLPRCLEGARYFAQWAGAPYAVYSGRNGEDDYADDINTRSTMTNWLCGGSVYAPTVEGKNVPIELSLAIHSDAGFSPDGKGLVGSLAICTTDFNDGKLSSGISRMASKAFAADLLNNTYNDLQTTFGQWNKRYLWDRNYSETRLPEVPSAILETMSHQNFPDMKRGQDPYFKFTYARSIYKTILKYIAKQHGTTYVVSPLAPTDFNIQFTGKDKIRLNWTPQADRTEPTALPTSYNLYIAMDDGGFDNGTNMPTTSCEIQLKPGHRYNFKVTAVNSGGESFPTLTLSAISRPNATKTILIVNGFNRLSSPAVIDTKDQQGFDLKKDIGVSYGLNVGWCGHQTVFDKSRMGSESGLGLSGNELMGKFIAGNDFSDVVTHAKSIGINPDFNVVSCSSQAIENGKVDLQHYTCVDYLLGLQKDDGYSLIRYKTLSPRMRQLIKDYLDQHGKLLISGSYIGSDLLQDEEKAFLSQYLKVSYLNSDSLTASPSINGMGLQFDLQRTLNASHYAATHPEILQPAEPGFRILQYADATSAAVAYEGRDYRCLTMGFPFECVASESVRQSLMQAFLHFLTK